MPGELFVHVAFVGIAVQGASAILIALLFVALRRLAPDRRYLADWSGAFLVLAAAIAALFVRYLASDDYSPAPVDFANAASPLTRALYVVYEAGKLLFFTLLLTGAARFAGRQLPVHRGVLIGLAVLHGVACVAIHLDLVALVRWQAPAAILCTAVAAIVLLRAPRERRSLGTRLTAANLALLALLWSLYGWAFGGAPWANAAARRFADSLMIHNSFIDVVVLSVLGFVMVIALLQDVERDREAARAERALLQGRLAQSRHLESLGAVVSGVAHELNNPLTAIIGYSEELAHPRDEDGEPDEEERAVAVRVIHEQSLRCRSIVRDLLAFARPRARPREPVALGALIERVVRGFGPALRSARVELAYAIAPALPTLDADPSALEQVLANLVDNALDVSAPGATISVLARRADDACEIVVEDEGPGVPSQVAERIFEPFFTTKEASKGTGLGLAVSHRIVTAHGGRITVSARSDGARGARFSVVLPARASPRPVTNARVDDTPPALAAPRAAEPSARRAPRILVVDDEPSVRGLVRRRLLQHGFVVVEAGDGAEALEHVRRSEPPIDAVITDLKMRGLSGCGLQEQLMKEQPKLARRVVAITGDVLAPDVSRFTSVSGCQVFEKPLDLERLVRHVAELARFELSRSVAGSA